MTAVKTGNPLRTAVHILAPIPLMGLVIASLTGNLTINPIQAATQRAGDFAIIFLLLTLACSPLNTLFEIPMVLKLRRPLGLWTFYYASLHLLTYTGLDYGFNFRLFHLDNANKPYILWGLLTITVLVMLALTSQKWWKKKLGKSWKKLHKLVYLAGIFAVVHLALVVKGNIFDLRGDLWKPLTAGSILLVLLLLRLPFVKTWIMNYRKKIKAARTLPPAGRLPVSLGENAVIDSEGINPNSSLQTKMGKPPQA